MLGVAAVLLSLLMSIAIGWGAGRSPDRLTERTQAAAWLGLLPILAVPLLLTLMVLPFVSEAPLILLLPVVGMILWPLWALVWKACWTHRSGASGVAYAEPGGRMMLAAGVTLGVWCIAAVIIMAAILR